MHINGKYLPDLQANILVLSGKEKKNEARFD